MSELDFRPRFRIYTALGVEEAEQILLEQLRLRNPEGFRSTIVKGHMVIHIAESKRHFWSPQMDVSIAATEEEDEHHPATMVRCLTAPAPAVWTMFMFFYGFAGFALLVGLIVASSQYTLGYEPWALWIAAFGLVLGLAMFLVAQVGKGLAKDEMRKMKTFVDKAFAHCRRPEAA